MSTGSAVPVILAVDVEPDRRLIEPGRPLPWAGYEALAALLGAQRPRLARATGRAVRFCWFFRMDPQIAEVYGDPAWGVRYYHDTVRAALAEGDELGLHQHAFRWDAAAGGWICDHANQAWVEHCVETGFEAFAAHFGAPCRAFRFGDRWLNDPTLRLVERLGARADLTVEPGLPAARAMVEHEPHTGSLPDYSDAPHVIYRPRREDFRRADPARAEGIRMVPISTGRVPARAGALVRALRRLAPGRARRGHFTSLNLAVSPPTFSRLLAQALGRRPLTHVAMVVRSDAAVRPRYRAHLQANLDALARHAEREAFALCTVQEAIDASAGTGRER